MKALHILAGRRGPAVLPFEVTAVARRRWRHVAALRSLFA